MDLLQQLDSAGAGGQQLLADDESARLSVDWQLVEEELRDVPEEYKEPKFYPLKHVVEIFSSGDPQLQTVELRDRESRLSDMVDMVVEGYHVGFARSIQNYSQILALFQDARQQIDNMKKATNDSIRQLAAHSRNLSQQWQRDKSLSASLQLLKDVQLLVALPARINDAVARRDWPVAVSLLLEACSRMARDEMRRVVALQPLKGELADMCRSVQMQLCEELMALAYSAQDARPLRAAARRGTSSAGASASGALRRAGSGGLELRGPGAARLGMSRAGSGGGLRATGTGAGGAATARDRVHWRVYARAHKSAGSASAVRKWLSGGNLQRPGHHAQQRAGPAAPAGQTGSRMPFLFAAALEDEAALAEPPAPDAEQLVACLASIDGVPLAKAKLSMGARTHVRAAMWRAAEEAAEAAAQSYHAVASAVGAGGGAGGGGGGEPGRGAGGAGGGALGVAQHLETLAQKLIQGVAEACLRVLSSLVGVLVAVADAPEPQPSAALDLIRAQQQQQQQGGRGGRGGVGPAASAGGAGGAQNAKDRERARDAYVRQGMMHVWMQMQEEWHAMLGQLLHSALRPLGTQGGAAAARKAAMQQQQQEGAAGQAQGQGGAFGILTQPLGWLLKIDELAEAVSSQVEAALGGQAPPPPPNAPPQGAGAAGGAAGAPGATGAGGAPGRPPTRRLHFTLDVQVRAHGGGSSSWTGSGPISSLSAADPETAQGYSRLVSKALGDQNVLGSVYLTPAVYLPLSTFVDAAVAMLKPYLDKSKAASGAGGAGARRRQMLAEQAGSALWLRDCVEDFVFEAFLPQVWVDLRARCTTALEHPDAFKPPAQALLMSGVPVLSSAAGAAPPGAASRPFGGGDGGGSAGAAGPGDGVRGVVPAARFAERMLRDVSAWSLAMPTFEGSFMGVAENILGRILDSFWLTLSSLAAGHRAFHLALRYDVALAQAMECDSVLLGPPMFFAVPRPGGPNGAAELDVAAFAGAVRSQARPELVQTSTGRAGLTAVCTQLAVDLDLSGYGGGPLAAAASPAGGPGRAGPSGGGAAPPLGPAGGKPGAVAGRGPLSAAGLEAELELQLLVFQERPQAAEQLMSRAGANTSRVASVAALAESLEYLAESVLRAALRQLRGTRGHRLADLGGGGRGGWRGRGGRGGARAAVLQQEQLWLAHAGLQQNLLNQLPDTLLQLVHRCRALSGLCVRMLRLELQLHVAHALHALAQAPHVVDPGDDAREALPQVGTLSRTLTRLADTVALQLSPGRASYVLAGVAPSAARMSMWLLPEVKELNTLGVDRLTHALSTLQPALMNLVPSLAPASGAVTVLGAPAPGDGGDGQGGAEAELRLMRMRAFDRARGYLQLLTMACEEVLRQAAERPMRYGYGEWMALLQVHVLGRNVADVHVAALQGVLDRAHGLTAGKRIAGAVGTVISTVIAAPEKVADKAIDVLKLGAEGLKAGALVPARQLGKAFSKLHALAKDVQRKAANL